jgi:uncharacterized protein YheU (UPF0270 family)
MINEKKLLLKNSEISGDGRILRISPDKLSPETLMAIIEECVTRNGTDYGEVEMPLERKIMQVHKEIISGRALILFDTKEQVCNIVSRDNPAIKGQGWFNM